MRTATSGTTLPTATFTWAVANQAVAATSVWGPIDVPCIGARTTMGPCVIAARNVLPRTAAGISPQLIAYCSADDQITWRAENTQAAALVALATAVTLDVIQLPVAP